MGVLKIETIKDRFSFILICFSMVAVLQVLYQTVLENILPWYGTLGNICIVLCAGGLFLHDFFHKRSMLQLRHVQLSIVFLIVAFISAVFNFKINFIDNLQGIAFLFVTMVVLFSLNFSSIKELLGGLYIFSLCVSIGIGFLSFYSLYLYLSDTVLYLYSGRFSGVFSNPNLSAFIYVCGIIISIMLIISVFALLSKWRILVTVFSGINILVLLINFVLTNSNTGMLMMSVAIFSIVWLNIYIHLNWKCISKVLFGIAVGGLAVVAFIIGMRQILFVASYLPAFAEQAQQSIQSFFEREEYGDHNQYTFEDQENNHIVPKQPLMPRMVQRKELEFQGANNGRFSIWSKGLHVLANNPLLGVGPRNIADAVRASLNMEKAKDEATLIEVETIAAGGMHNTFIEMSITTGVLGLAAFLSIIIWSGLQAVVYIFKIKNFTGKHANNAVFILLTAGVLMLLCGNLTESILCFSINMYSMVFWIFSGFYLNYIRLQAQK